MISGSYLLNQFVQACETLGNRKLSQLYKLFLCYRYNYTTPKSFLEQIDLYKHLVAYTNTELTKKMDRLENGLLKLQNTSEQVKYEKLIMNNENCT